MRILMFTNAYHPTVSGVVTSISLFRRGLIEAGHEVHLIAPDYKDYIDPDPYIFRFPAWDLNESINISLIMPIMGLMAPTIQGLKPQIIHSHHPLLMGGMAAEFAADLQVPLVFTFHTRYDEYAQRYIPMAPDLASSLTEEVIRRYLIRCSHIIAPTPSVKDMIHEEYDIGVPVTVIPTPIALDEYQHLNPAPIREKYGLSGHHVLLFVGRMAEEKNIPLLLEAFAIITATRPNTKLLMVGDGPKEKSLKTLASKLALSKSVIFCGSVSHKEVPHFSAASDLFVFPSETETQGLVILEALAAGTPAVAVAAPGSSDILSFGGGLLVEGNVKSFSEAVLKLLADADLRKALGTQALEVAKQYAIPSRTAQLSAVYQAAIAAGPRSREAQKLDDRSVFQSFRTVLTPAQKQEKTPLGISTEFLDKIRKLVPGHLVVELIHRLLINEIKSLKSRNTALARTFSRKSIRIMTAYESQSIEAGQTISDLISLATELRQTEMRLELPAIGPEIQAFYNTLASDDNLVELIETEDLHDLARAVQALISDHEPAFDPREHHREKNLRPQIANLLAEYNYPEEQIGSAVDVIIEQVSRFKT